MRKAFVLLLALVALRSAAGTIYSIDPSTIPVASGEYFLTISGTGLGNLVQYSGPAGDFTLEASSWSDSTVIVWVPPEIVNTVGTYSVVVLGGTGDTAPAFLEITDDPPPPQPLTIHVPEAPSAPADGPDGAIVNYSVSVTGGSGANPVVTCNPPSGSTFPVGTTTVQCFASNDAGETDEAAFTVTVYDITRPVLTLPDDIVVVTEDPNGATVTFTATAQDDVDGAIPVSCVPASGSFFPVGITEVTCTATDASQNSTSGTFTVEVVHQETLVIHVPGPITAEATGPDGAAVSFVVTADGTSDPSPEVTCTPASGSTFPLGTTTVQCTATDDSGNTASGSFEVTVVDTTAPVIASVTATPGVITPANKKLVNVTIGVSAMDVVDPAPQCLIYDVTSNQTLAAGDVQLTGALTLQLRATRSNNQDRIYTVHVRCTDDAANSSTSSVNVTVTK